MGDLLFKTIKVYDLTTQKKKEYYEEEMPQAKKYFTLCMNKGHEVEMWRFNKLLKIHNDVDGLIDYERR